ncbi:MAG: Crp/Fnr family transcriptional regulator [Terriglobia bacterium]
MQPTKLWYIERLNLFKGIQQRDKEELVRISLMEKKPKGSFVYLPSDPANSVFLLKEGHVRISRITEDGREITLTMLSPGEIFGEVALVDDSPRDHVAQAIDEVLLCEFKKRDFESFVQSRPDLAFRIIKLIGLRFRTMETRVVDLICKDVTTRVCELLMSLADKERKSSEASKDQKIRLTHQDIASLVGVSRQTTTETLDRIKSKGFIDLGHRSIVIKDRVGLESLARARAASRSGN